jgi:colicin import membrane protein
VKDLIAKIRKALGDEGKALADELDKAADALSTELDTAKADAATQKKAVAAAEKAQKKAEADAAKAASDLEAKTKGEGDELAKLRSERDDWKAKAESADTRVAEVRKDAKLREAASKAGLRDLDGLKMLDLDGVSLDDKGELVGADALFKAAKKAKPYLFADAGGGGGGTPGNPPRPGDTGGGSGGSGEKTARDLAKEILGRQGVKSQADLNKAAGVDVPFI